MDDLQCICSNQELQSRVQTCLASSCTIRQILATKKQQSILCGAPIRDDASLTRRATWPLFGIALFSVIFRFLARSRLLEGPGVGWDDWTILIALSLLVAASGLLDQMTRIGLGKDTWMLEPQHITDVLYMFFVLEFVYIGILVITKISILLLYLRIFPSTVSTWFRVTVWIVIGLCSAYCLAMWFSILFECDPIGYNWTRWDGEHKGNCINARALIYSSSTINIVLDLMVFFLPFPKLMKLEVSGRKKVGICLTFVLGLFITICSAVRLQYLVRWGDSKNPTWDYNPIAIWSAVEGNVSIICCCLPAMAGPIKKALQKTRRRRFSYVEFPESTRSSYGIGKDVKPHSQPADGSEAPDMQRMLHISAVYGDSVDSQRVGLEEEWQKKLQMPSNSYPHGVYTETW
ncbi:hypothetical protein KC360_g7098 [Hortaea werneckii]|nr:hypothetical protein KC325_g7022 [Hortaea werneckii]KAI7001375.1 hypothetical protein KC359_g744 [Hortaea werneckii]KAI7142651.1 hypothetical protein KC344_g6978 [Hortaea werneckii]KAI7170019.1 hypothetical protein KC360_g7098 [Hortaea werneckii]